MKYHLCSVQSSSQVPATVHDDRKKTGIEVPLSYGQINLCTAHDSFWATSSHWIEKKKQR